MKTVDIIIIMLSATVCLIMIMAAISPLITGKPLTDIKAKMLVGVLGSIVSIISFYIGRRIGGGR